MRHLTAEFTYETTAADETVERLLQETWKAGKKTVHLMRMAKSVTDAAGQPVNWKESLPSGTRLLFQIPEAVSSYVPAPYNDLEVLFEDEHLLAAVKPAGVATHPNSPDGKGTFMNEVMGYIAHHGGAYAEHVHRLDDGTRGVLLIAKHPIAKTILDRQIAQHEIKRFYTAQVEGIMKRPSGTIHLPIGRDRHHPTRRRVSMSGQSAITHYKVLRRLADSTMVEVQLETGRTHQIRVHLAHLGHPILGDVLYGSTSSQTHYALIASKVEFQHPITGEQTIIEIPM